MTIIKIWLVKLLVFVINCILTALYTPEEIQKMENEFCKEKFK